MNPSCLISNSSVHPTVLGARTHWAQGSCNVTPRKGARAEPRVGRGRGRGKNTLSRWGRATRQPTWGGSHLPDRRFKLHPGKEAQRFKTQPVCLNSCVMMLSKLPVLFRGTNSFFGKLIKNQASTLLSPRDVAIGEPAKLFLFRGDPS